MHKDILIAMEREYNGKIIDYTDIQIQWLMRNHMFPSLYCHSISRYYVRLIFES